jgi:hypothetical protein
VRKPVDWLSVGVLSAYIDARKRSELFHRDVGVFGAQLAKMWRHLSDGTRLAGLFFADRGEQGEFESWYDACYLFEYGGK